MRRNPLSVLIVSGKASATAAITDMLSGETFHPVSIATSGSDCRRTLIDCEFDLVVINAPLPDEQGVELAEQLSESGDCVVILTVPSQFADEAAYAVEDAGVLTVGRPIDRRMFTTVTTLAAATCRRLAALRRENDNLQVKIKEIRTVDRAKAALMSYLNMTEAQAHRHIEKRAMDGRTTKAAVATEILATYGDGRV